MIDISMHLKHFGAKIEAEVSASKNGDTDWLTVGNEFGSQALTVFCKSARQAEALRAAFLMHEDEASPAPAEYDDRDAPWTGQAEDMATGAAPPTDPDREREERDERRRMVKQDTYGDRDSEPANIHPEDSMEF